MILYPLIVRDPDGAEVHRPAKAVASEGVTRVYVWDPAVHDAVEVLTLSGTPEKVAFRQWSVGGYTLAETGGCGCGHPLKRWHPPAPVVA